MSTGPSSAPSIQHPPSIGNIEEGSSPPSVERRTALKACEIQKQLHFYQFPDVSRPLFTSASTAALDCASDYSYVIRQFFNNFNIDSPLLTKIGMTTACNSMTGAVAAIRAYDRLQEAKAIDYNPGKIEARIDIVRGVLQSIGGIFYTAYRPLSVAVSIQGIDASSASVATAIGRGTFITGAVGNAFFGGVYLAMSGYFAYMLKRMYSFRSKFFQDKDIKALSNVKNVQQFMKFLTEKRLGVSPQSTLQKMFKLYSNSPREVAESKVKKELKAVCMESTKTWIKAILKEAKTLPSGPTAAVSEKECGQMAEKLFAELDQHVPYKQMLIQSLKVGEMADPELRAFAQALSLAELLGLDIKTSKREKTKEAKLAEFVGIGVATSLKKAKESALTERLASSDPVVQKAALEEAQSILKEAGSNMRIGLFNDWCLLLAGVLGVIVTIAAFVFTGGISTIIIGSLFLACALGMLFPDLIYLRSAQIADGRTGKFDQWLLGLSTFVGVVTIITVLVVGSIFSMGTVPMAIALAIGILWLTSNCYSHYQLYKKEAKYGFNNPTLESLAKKIHVKTREELIDQKMMEQFKKLSIMERKAVKAEAMKLGSIMSSSERSLSEEDQKLDNAHDFGQEFFNAHTKDAAVLRAAEKALESARSDALRGLYDRLVSLSKTEGSDAEVQEIKDFFTKKMTSEEKSLVAQNIYNKRAKKASSRSFERITLATLKKALVTTSIAKKAEHENARLNFLQHSIELFDGFGKSAVA